MARVPIIRFGEILVATVQEDLYDRDVLDLQDTLTAQLEATGARGVLIDVSVVETVDLRDTALGARLLGAYTVVVGIQPAVAVTLVELGLELSGVRTALNAEQGLGLLRRLLAAERRGSRAGAH